MLETWGRSDPVLRISQVVAVLFQLYTYTLFARILLSWIPVNPTNPTVRSLFRFIYDMTEPVMRPFRQVLPPIGGLDLSPLLLFLLLRWLARAVVSLLWGLGL